MPEKEMEVAEAHSRRCDLFIVLGSSLVVQPASNMPVYACRAKAKLVIVNQGETPCDRLAHLRFHEGIIEVLPPAVERAKAILSKRK